MLRSLKSMEGFAIKATDGDLGKVYEFYFDDVTWIIRYLIVETGSWLFGRKLLISFTALGKPDWETCSVPVNLTRDQIKNSPDIDTERPVHRQHETDLHEYYKWPRYWDTGYRGTLGITPQPLFENPFLEEPISPGRHDDPHLRSTKEVTGYHILASDGKIGHVEDFVADDNQWAMRYLVVDTRDWIPGRKVMVPLKCVKSVNWEDDSVLLDRSREEVKNSPEFDASKTVC